VRVAQWVRLVISHSEAPKRDFGPSFRVSWVRLVLLHSRAVWLYPIEHGR